MDWLAWTRNPRLVDALWLCVFGIASSIAIVAGSSRLSATFDEPTYLQQGLECWRTGSYKGLMRLGTMPLPIDLQTLPIYLTEQFRGEPFDVQQDFHRLLPWARSVTLVFWWILLGYGMLIAGQLGGPWAGRIAVAFLALEPTLMAHAGLATTDVAVAAMLLAFGYHFARGRESGWLLRIGLPAALYAASILAKASGLVFGPILMLAVEVHRWCRQPRPETTESLGWKQRLRSYWDGSRPLRRDSIRIVAIGLALTFFYIGSDWKAETTFVKWAESLPDGRTRDTMLWLTTNTCVFTNAGEGIVQQIKHNLRGHGAFLLDESWKRSVWYYFPVALSIKLTLPLLAALAATLLLRPKSHLQWPSLAALALFLFSFNARVQIGVRLILPLIALATIGTAIALVRSGILRRRPYQVGLAAALILGLTWSAASLHRTWPNGLCYVNELWGSPDSGYRLLSDSNFDWGQGLVELEAWANEHGMSRMAVWYFGTDPAARKAPFRLTPVHVLPDSTPEAISRRAEGGILAVGTTILYGAYLDDNDFVKYLRTLTPIDRTSTFLIYQLPMEQVAKKGNDGVQ